MPSGGLQGTATNTLQGEDVLGMLEAAAQEQAQALAQRTQQTGEAANQAQGQYQQAAQAPQEVPNDFVQNLFSNLASVVSQQPSYRENQQQVAAQNKADLLKKRADNLQALHDIYGQKAEEAQRAGDLETTEKYRTKREALHDKLVTVNQAAERADRANQNALDRQAALERAKLDAGRQGSGATGQGFDPDAIAQSIHDGNVAPDPTGFSRGQWGMIVGSMRKLDPKYNLMKSGIDFQGVRQFVRTLNQGQQVQLRQRAQNAMVTADYINSLIDDIKAKAPARTPVTAINRAQLNAVKNGAWGTEAAVAATKLEAQIRAYRLEMASVYSGGYAPQEAHLKEANGLIDPNWSLERIGGGLEIGRRDTNIRLNAVNEVGAVTPSNPLTPGTPAPGSVNIGPNAMGFGTPPGETPVGTPAPTGPAPAPPIPVIGPKGQKGVMSAEDFKTWQAKGWKRAPINGK